MSRECKVKKIREAIEAQTGHPITLTCDGERLQEHAPIEDCGDADYDDELEFMARCEQRGGKPVIYLQPPQGRDIEAEVTLSLVPEWTFSAIYPVVGVEPGMASTHNNAVGGQHLKWNVIARSDGTLVDTKSGSEVAYLYWEAG